MQNERLIVKYVPVKNCFVLLPSAWHRKLSSQVGVIKLSNVGKDFYLSPTQSQSSPGDFLCISATFGKCLEVKEGAEVDVSYIFDPPALTTIDVRPVNSEDWQIVSLQADKIQSTLLDQINIVSPSQPIVIWLSKYLNVTLVVESISPPFLYGKLENYTEVHIQDAREGETAGVTVQKEITAYSTSKKNETDCEVSLKRWRYQKLPEIFRICLVSLEEKYRASRGVSEVEISSAHNIFMFSNRLRELFPARESLSMIYGKIESVFKEKQGNFNFTLNNRRNIPHEPEIIASLSPVEDFFSEDFLGTHVDDKSIWISESLRKSAHLQLGSKVHIKPVTVADNAITSLEIISAGNIDRENLETNFKKYVHQHSLRTDLILSQNSIITSGDLKCRLKLLPEDVPHVLLNAEKLKTLKIEITDEENPQESEEAPQDNLPAQEIYETPFREILEDSLKILRMGLAPQDYSFPRENIFICGDLGTGKTTVLNCLQRKLESPPNFLHTILIDCKKLKGRKVDAVSKFFSSTMHDCVCHQPSVLLLDNLDSITSYPSDNDENSPDALNASRISDYLSSLLTAYQTSHLVSAVASGTRLERLGVRLRPSRGVHVFQTILGLVSLSPEERLEFLRFKLGKKIQISREIDWGTYSGKTEGWVFQDLSDFCEKAMFLGWRRSRSSPVLLEDEDLAKALGMIKPLSLYGVSLFSGEGNSWGDIGGLEEVKESLRQMLQWPLMYPGLFKKAPVRHQTGVLLYGMPGTGKTMLAGAIARECGLNFINIKGPELLSKYIGASEEAVRSVFEKAQRIKPCIVFFDEFESLAPRRGHDSTGVTDRVVNQLLTQFDGVEGREGVAIVAASSRPDLLDPALLRPGRLDKSLLCPLPDEQTRATILHTLCKRQDIDDKDLDLVTLARMTSGFTGADLTAVITQARLDAVEECLGQPGGLEGVRITQDMLIRSLEDTQPSLTTGEVNKFNRIYNRFLKGDNVPEDLGKHQKATLA